MNDLSVTLKLYNEDEVRRIAVCSINNASTTDHGTPRVGGLNDARMGSTDRSILCQTCHVPHCAGHLGMIEFPQRVLLSGHIKYVVAMLRCVCVCCSEPLSDFAQFEHVEPGFEKLKIIAEYCRNKVSECGSCGSPVVEYAESNKIFITKTAPLEKLSKDEADWHRKKFTPDDIYSILDKIPESTLKYIGLDSKKAHPRNALTNVIFVLPPAQRPTLRIADGGKSRGEDDMTVLYQDVIRAKLDLETKPTELAFQKLQLMVSCLVNNALRKTVVIPGLSSAMLGQRTSVRTMRDLENRLKGKAGRLRGTLNAKRTDFSARTVIGIDMCKDIWKLGVPETRMKILTIPDRVTDINMEEMQRRVIIGAHGKDGAVNILQPIEGKEPRMIFLGLMKEDTRMALASSLRVGWIVERHLKEGDWVLFNRQPTLHKMNIQAFQIYPVKGLTFRLPLPDTRPFNADYDGDEMNLNVPQSIAATTECQEIMSVPHNMISPSNLSAIIALVQESLVAWFRLTRRDCLLTRDQFMQIAAQISYDPNSETYHEMPIHDSFGSVNIPAPAILKPMRWTGKQVLELLLPKTLNLNRAVRDGDIKDVGHWMSSKEEIIFIKNGELLLGRLCKATLGGGPSLVHQIWKDYGPWAAAKFVSDAQRVSNVWNQYDAVCIGIRDCLLDDSTNDHLDDLVATAMAKADSVHSTQFSDEIKEMRITSLMQDVLRGAGAMVLKEMDRESALAEVVVSGSKGNAMNLSQIMGVVGQQSIGGKRVLHRKTRMGMRGLISYKPNDNRPEAHGFIATSYIQGQTEAEFYHSMMAGREGIVATAIETATSGYNQRKMVKISEGQIVAYDRTVRISSNEVVSFHYGGDDYDPTGIERVKISIHRISDESLMQMLTLKDGPPSRYDYSVCLQARNFLRTLLTSTCPGEYGVTVVLPFQPSRVNEQMLDIKDPSPKMTRVLYHEWISRTILSVLKLHGTQSNSILSSFLKKDSKPWAKSASIILLTWTCAFIVDGGITIAQCQWLKTNLLKKIAEALVAPGEAVGTIGATSIGEPSTQGALNTFHFSGIAEKSGTTGLKRFKEILSNAKCAESCVVSALVDKEERANEIIKKVKCVYLHKLIESISIGDIGDKNALAKRQAQMLSWVKSWMSPLSSKLDKSVQQSLDKSTFNVANDTAVVEIKLSKVRCLQEEVVPSEICQRLRLLLLDMCFIASSEIFEDEWLVRIVPFPVEEFVHESIFDSRSICEALIDVFNTNVLVRGLPIVSEIFHVPSKIDTVLESGGIGKREFRKIGCVGSDLIAMAYRVDNPALLWTNDIHETALYLGIESATALNSSELQRVLSFDSTYIDPRHTLLLAETMGRSGAIAALNRHKMEELGSSLLSRASFEQTRRVIEDAAFFYRSDPLTGSLERQIVGLPLRVGTGIVALLEEKVHHETSIIAPLEKEKPWIATQVISGLAEERREGISVLPISMEWSPHILRMREELEDASANLSGLVTSWVKEIGKGLASHFRISFASNPGQFVECLKRASSYLGWEDADLSLEWQQTTKIIWNDVATIVDSGNAAQTGKTSRFHGQKTVIESANLRIKGFHVNASVSTYSALNPALPVSVLPSRVFLRHKKTFAKGGWHMVFKKTWSAPNFMEAHAKQISSEPEYCISVSAISAEASYNQVLKVQDVMLQKVWDIL